MTATISQLRTAPAATAAPTLEAFLASVERRAYRSALLTTKKAADALDIVQDSMLQLVDHYADKDADAWPLLFQRILNNKLMDWHRHQQRQRRWFWQPSPLVDEEGEEAELEWLDERADCPAQLLERARDIETLLAALETLPLRQRQAFLLRAWEGLDVQATAEVMGCGQGSVKTHYFRALASLRQALLPSDEPCHE